MRTVLDVFCPLLYWPDRLSWPVISHLLNLSSAITGQVFEQILYTHFSTVIVHFISHQRGNFLCNSSGSCLSLLVQLEGIGGGWRFSVILLVKIKAFLQRHHVIHLPVNDTSSSYIRLNDLVCVALLVVRETAGGSLEMSLVIVWRCRQAQREMETKTEKRTERERVHRSHL